MSQKILRKHQTEGESQNVFLANILTVGLLFIAISAVSLAFRLLNHFRKDARIYLMHTVCALVGLWSLGLALVRVAPSYERAFFWQRISALGWTTVYGVLLHLFLILHKSRLCQKWWTYVLVYLPALLSLMAFSLLPELAQKTQHLVLVNPAWVVLPVMDSWNLLFQFYCTISVVLSSFLLLRLGSKSKDPAQKRQGTLLAFSLLLAIALGILLDRIFIPRHLPELSNLAPGIALVPMTFFYRFIRIHQEFWGLKYRQFAQNVAKGEILSETDKVALYRFLGGIYILAGFGYAALAVLAQRPSLENRIFWGVVILFLGMGLYSLTVLTIPEKRRDVLVGAVLSFSAFLLWFEITRVLGRSDIFISLSLLPFILPSILSGSRWAFAMVSAVFFSIQAYLWIGPQLMGNPPEVILTQILITVLSGLAILVFLLVRHVYLRRLEENWNQLDTQELIAGVSSQLIRSRPQDVEENLRKILSRIATKLNMSWAFLGVLAEDGSLRYRIYLKITQGELNWMSLLSSKPTPNKTEHPFGWMTPHFLLPTGNTSVNSS